MKERESNVNTTHTVTKPEKSESFDDARRLLATRSLEREPEPAYDNAPSPSSDNESGAVTIEVTTRETSAEEALQSVNEELSKPAGDSHYPSPRQRRLAQNMSVLDSVTADLWDEKKTPFKGTGARAVKNIGAELAAVPVGYVTTKAATLASAGVIHMTTGLPFNDVRLAHDGLLSKLDYPEAVFMEWYEHGNLDFLGTGQLFLDTVKDNGALAGIVLSTLYAMGKVVERVSEYSEEKAMVSTASPIRQYEDAIRTQLTINKGSEEDFTLDNKVASGRGYINELNLSFPMKLATIKSPETGGIYQVPLELAHALSVIRMFAEKGNGLAGVESLDVFKNSGACQAIFSNAETIAKSLETRIDDFATFAVSVHHAIKGMEYNIFDLTPQQQKEFLSGEMNAGEKLAGMFNRSEKNKENKKQFNPEFAQMVVSSGASAWMEMHQRQVMKVALTDISKKLEGITVTRDENGELLSVFDDRYRTVDLSEMGRATEVIWTIKSAMKEFDVGEKQTVYAPLCEKLDALWARMESLTRQHLESGEPLALSDVSPILEQWIAKKGEPEAVWNLLLPELEFEPTVDGLAAAHLMRAVTDKVEAKEGLMPDNAMSAEELTKDVAETAVYDYAHRRGRR